MRQLGGEWRRPIGWGLAGVFGLSLFYVLTIALASRSWEHVSELLRQDWYFVLAILAGFGIQVALYTRLRAGLKRKTGSVAVAAAGTGTSSASMIACCLHHVTDVLPVVGLSGAAIFLNDYRSEVMAFGVLVNVAGILFMVRTLRKSGIIR